MWVPHTGIRGNEAADRAATEDLDKEPINDLMPFSDLKPLTAKCIHQVWQIECGETVTVFNKRHESLPKLSDKLLLVFKTKKKDTVLNIFHTGHSIFFLYFFLFFFVEKEEPPVFVAC